MKIAIIILVAILVGLFLYFTFKNKVTKKNGIILGFIFIIILALIIIYTTLQDRNNKKQIDLIFSFNQGKELQCGDLIVQNKNFNFISGTLSFVGKKKTKFEDKIIPIEECL
ncbi:MAG: hypothetical protein K2P17_06855 [Helicobacteraceae bacterium]|nr:hypothetical protein [Helicobacteraceae bacterium]